MLDRQTALRRVTRNWVTNSTSHGGRCDSAADAIIQTWAEVTDQTWQAAQLEILAHNNARPCDPHEHA